MAKTTRCPKCGGFGSSELKGHCKPCYEAHIGPVFKNKKQKNSKSVFGGFENDFNTDGPFIPDSFGILKDKFGLQERYEDKR